MASAPVIEFEELLAPIPGDLPAGQPASFDVIRQLDDLRKEGDPFGPPRKQDWPGIINIASDALQNQSKDMLIAARLLEGLTRRHGFAGLRDGLILIRRLLEECWDRLLPIPEEGEGFEIRGGPILWLNDVSRGAKFPQALLGVPFVEVQGVPFGHLEWSSSNRSEFEAVFPKIDRKKFRETYENLLAAREELAKLSQTVDTKIPDLGINLMGGVGTMGTILSECITSCEDVMDKLGLPLKESTGDNISEKSSEGEASESPAVSSTVPGLVKSPVGMNRADLYRQLDVIADALQKLEPHSPIPFLIKRAVKLGALPFPQLIRAMIQETQTLDDLDRLLGIEKPAE
jgi:type VI secretion system protein ImpA